MLVRLSVCSKVQIVCIRSCWCHCIHKTPSSLASFKSRPVLPFWYRLSQVVQEQRPLNGCAWSWCGVTLMAAGRRLCSWQFEDRACSATLPLTTSSSDNRAATTARHVRLPRLHWQVAAVLIAIARIAAADRVSNWVSDTPGNPGNLLEIYKICWKSTWQCSSFLRLPADAFEAPRGHPSWKSLCYTPCINIFPVHTCAVYHALLTPLL